jgi:hypothetical protein
MNNIAGNFHSLVATMYSAEKIADVAAAAAYSSLTKYCSYSIL